MNSKLQCPICSKNNTEVFNNSTFFYRSFTYNKPTDKISNYLCRSCGLIWQNPQPTNNQLSEHYANQYRQASSVVSHLKKNLYLPIQLNESQNSFLRAQSFLDIFKELNLSFPTKGKILDIGGYQGLFAWALSSFTGLKAKIIDYNPSGLKFASSFLGIEKQEVSEDILVTLSENAKNSFSIISMVHSLEHMRAPKEVIKLSVELLKDEGYLYIEVPNSLGSGLNDPTHLYTFNKNSLNLILHSNNLEIIYLESGSLSHKADPEFSNKNVIIRALAQKTKIEAKKLKNTQNVNYKKLIRKSLYLSSLNTIFLVIQKFFKEFFILTYKILGWLIYDFVPFGRQFFHNLRNFFRR
tara:strand:- start:3574 stop:4632 length:1059 start_codon:yes stop_codon:yes gene_type:complete